MKTLNTLIALTCLLTGFLFTSCEKVAANTSVLVEKDIISESTIMNTDVFPDLDFDYIFPEGLGCFRYSWNWDGINWVKTYTCEEGTADGCKVTILSVPGFEAVNTYEVKCGRNLTITEITEPLTGEIYIFIEY